jgi:protease I
MDIDLGNTKIQLVAAQENFRDEELFVPEDVFSAAGAFVLIASNEKRTAHGMLGGCVEPDLAIRDIDVDSLDALVIAGGSGSIEYLWGNEALLGKVREADVKGKVIGAICLAGVVLAQAGAVKGKRCTVFPTAVSLAELKRHGAIYVKQGLVADERVVTAEGPGYARPFAEAVLDLVRARMPLAQR